MIRTAPIITLVLAFAVSPALAHVGKVKHHHGQNGAVKKVVVVKPVAVKRPKVVKYYRRHLPKSAVFAVIGGVSYAIVNGHYYRHQNGVYHYHAQPPVKVAKLDASVGAMVEVLPAAVSTVTVNGVTFYVDGSVWYAPIAGSHQFVIVEPQL